MNQPATSPSTPPTLLFIDDEANILAALKRVFRPLGYNVLTAAGGAEGLALMEKQPVDLVISDMRMPQMSGAEVLEQIRLKWPEVVRILLTGYADLDSTIAAINRGEISRYISKPWNDDDIILIVRDALERKFLLAEKRALEALALRQNEELKALNASLEDKVRQRTEALQKTMASLAEAHEKLKKGYFTTIQVFANLMELRKGTMAGHSRRIAELCRGVANKMGLSAQEIQDLEVAALLHNIGKIGLPDSLLDKPYAELSYAERTEFEKHPVKAAAALMALDELVGAAKLIHCHHEHFNGLGYPSRLSGSNIPLGARILLVASDYDALQTGLMGSTKLSPADALKTIVNARSTRYDPAVVDVFKEVAGSTHMSAHVVKEFLVTSAQLREGLLLTRDVETRDGMLLLMKNTALNAEQIKQIRDFERTDGHPLTIYTHSM